MPCICRVYKTYKDEFSQTLSLVVKLFFMFGPHHSLLTGAVF